jgi:hypothetical protein
MAQFFSAIIANKGKDILWLPDSDAHIDILKRYNIKDDSLVPNFAAVQLNPPDDYTEAAFNNIASWKLMAHQDYIPEWFFDVEIYRKDLEKIAVQQIKERVICSGRHRKETGEFFLFNDSFIELYGTAGAKLKGKSSAILHDESKVHLLQETSAVLYDRSYAKLLDVSFAELHNNSKAHLCDTSTSKLHDSSFAKFSGSSSGTLFNTASAELYEKASAVFRDSSSAELHQQSSGIFYDNSKPKLVAKTAQFSDCRKKRK